MNKKIKILLIVLAILALILAAILFITPNNIKKYDAIMDSLFEKYSTGEYTSVCDEHIAIISVGDKKNQAIVKSAEGKSLEEAFAKAKYKINSIVKAKNYDVKLVKLDIVYQEQTVSLEEFNSLMEKNKSSYNFRRGIIINKDIALLEEEINANDIINYGGKGLNLQNLNNYLEKRGEKPVEDLPQELIYFASIRYFCDEDGTIYKLYDDDLNTGRRVIENITKEEVEAVIKNASKYLANMIKKDGQFVYGYRAITNKELSSYNILRHAGSVWSLIVCYDENASDRNERKVVINRAMDYLINQIKQRDEDTSYVIVGDDNEIKLGGCAIPILAMCEYAQKFEDSKYIETAKKLGNGILTMQKDNGSYVHIINANDYQVKAEQQTVYYDGEATFALAKLYGITKEEKYLEAAKKAIQYFIDHNYEQYCDHWVAYSVNEITKYVDNDSYYKFGVKNIEDNLSTIQDKLVTSHTNFEMLVQGYELYNRIKEKQIELDYDILQLMQILKYRANYQLNSYMYPEIAMYLTEPSKYEGTFFIRDDAFRVRIDDIQHSLLGYYYFLRIME